MLGGAGRVEGSAAPRSRSEIPSRLLTTSSTSKSRRSSSASSGGGGRKLRAASASAPRIARTRAGSVHRTKSPRSSAQLWYRSSGFLLISLRTTAANAAGTPRARLSSGRRVLHSLLENLVDHVAPLERRAAGQREIERAAQAVQVAPDVGLGCVAKLFRARVVECAQHRVGPRQPRLVVQCAGQDPGRAASPRPSGVIMMFDGLMSRWIRPALWAASSPSTTFKNSRAASGTRSGPVPLVLDQVVQALARDVLHHHEMHVAFAAHRERAGQVRVRTALGEFHLAAKSPQGVLFLERLPRGQHLDRNLPAIVADRPGRPSPCPLRRSAASAGNHPGRTRGWRPPRSFFA